MTLFTATELRSRHRRVRDRARVRIPTGGARLGESTAARLARQKEERVRTFWRDVKRSARARLDLLRGRPADEVLTCPWSRLEPCVDCRCGGTGLVTVGLLVRHYTEMSR